MPLMASNQTVQQVERLIDEHKNLRDEPLLLAVLFEPDRHPGDIFLLEVIDGFGSGMIDQDKKLFEVSYSSTASFPLPSGRHLRLVLTSPQEFEIANQEHWASIEEVRHALRAGSAQVLFCAPDRPDLEAMLNA